MTVFALGASVLLAGAPASVLAQDESPAIPRNKRPVRRPVIDLEKAAKQPRPGQILPGDNPAPADAEPAAAASSQDGRVATPEPAGAADSAPAVPAAARPAPTAATVPPASDAADPVLASVVEVSGPSAQVQWRRLSEGGETAAEWGTIEAGGSLEGRIELRTGLSGAATLDVDSQTALRFGRLTRARLERRITRGRPELVVHLLRGRVVVEPRSVDAAGLASVPVRVVTPAGTAVRRVAVEIVYDAMSGMRETVLKRE